MFTKNTRMHWLSGSRRDSQDSHNIILIVIVSYLQLAEPRDQKDPVVRWPTVGSSAIPLRLGDLYPFFIGYFQMKLTLTWYYIHIDITVFL